MATGIQTGIRRGSRVSTAAAQPQTALQRCKNGWSALSRTSKIAIVATTVLLQITLMGLGLYSRQTGYIDLYPTKLQTHEVPDISRALLEMGIEHEVSPASDGIKVSKSDKLKARAGLASRNLPLHRVVTAEEGANSMGRTAAERKALEQRILEGEITLALRDVDGIQNARVKLSVPDKSHWNSDKDAARASVTLTMDPGHTLDRAGISGLLHLVAFSVPGLTPENVRLVSTQGTDLSAMIPRDTEGGMQTSGAHFEVRSTEEKRLQEKVQQALDVVSEGRTKVVVNLDLDFSTMERRLYTPGSEKDDGLVQDSLQLVSEMLDTEKGEKDSKNFKNEKKSVNYKYTENYMATLAKHARTERLSATVFANGASPTEAANLKESVEHALGVQDERGDSVFIDTTPWNTILMPVATEDYSDIKAGQEASASPLSTSGMVAFLLAQAALMIAGFSAYFFLSSRRRPEAEIEVSALPGFCTTVIVDHSRNKIGETTADLGRTGVQTTEMLAGIVRERPTQVADLLRSTWLS